MTESTEKTVGYRSRWKSILSRGSKTDDVGSPTESDDGTPITKWSMGVLNDPRTHEVPGSVLLLAGHRNEPLGLRHAPARTSATSIHSGYRPPPSTRRESIPPEDKKTTKNGAIILDPQPDESKNDPLNWPAWRRDSALLSLGLYCMVGGGVTPILAAGFTNVAKTYNVSVPKVALTTGLYMMGLGVGSVFASPTAILWGKRPVYMVGAVLFIVTSIWCAVSPSYNSLLVARTFQGMSVSPVECLPSATIAEIFFLHERAYRIGIYGLLLLGGKNIVPLVSAAIIQTLGWRWVFWILAFVVAFCLILLFIFVPESFWDRSPKPKSRTNSRGVAGHLLSRIRSGGSHDAANLERNGDATKDSASLRRQATERSTSLKSQERRESSSSHPERPLQVGFAAEGESQPRNQNAEEIPRHQEASSVSSTIGNAESFVTAPLTNDPFTKRVSPRFASLGLHQLEDTILPSGAGPPTPALYNLNSPFYSDFAGADTDCMGVGKENHEPAENVEVDVSKQQDVENPPALEEVISPIQHNASNTYTHGLRSAPAKTFTQQLKPWNGRLTKDKWLRVAFRPFILYTYPAVVWSSIVYSCSIGWLIVLSESMAVVFRSPKTYNFSALSTGLVYLSPFIGGILGTAVAGKVSDFIVRAMAKRNGGLYEPEFRLVMAIPIAIATVIGLMGFGWSAAEHDTWIVPTIFFGIISFGCSLGGTTAITFCVDSYRQYAGEALVTLNFSKNIFHGLVFSLFFPRWLQADGSKKVFIALGGIQLAMMTLTVPMYVFGKRARMWTVRKNLMERF